MTVYRTSRDEHREIERERLSNVQKLLARSEERLAALKLPERDSLEVVTELVEGPRRGQARALPLDRGRRESAVPALELHAHRAKGDLMAVNASDISPTEERRRSIRCEDSPQDVCIREEHDSRRCEHIYPEGHEKAGQQCQGMRGASGYCPPHARLLGLLPALPSPRPATAPAQPGQPEQQKGPASAEEMAQASLTASAAAWLASPKTQKALRARWDDILANGSDAELIRLVKELTDRVEGRPTEHVVTEAVTDPQTIAEVRAMTPEQRRAFIRRKTEEAQGD